jgi:uncharacterized membrane protein HdeD (DUF308 family)
MSTQVAARPGTTENLRRLYFARFGFAAAWAATFAGLGSALEAGSIALLVLYPAVDVVAAGFDARRTRNRALYANIAVSTAAVIGLAVAAADDIPAVLRTWGAWAIVAGVAQLFVALQRRALGGQLPMILSGGISVLAGGGFLAQAGGATSMTMLAGYAALGGVFFLISAVRLRREGLG